MSSDQLIVAIVCHAFLEASILIVWWQQKYSLQNTSPTQPQTPSTTATMTTNMIIKISWSARCHTARFIKRSNVSLFLRTHENLNLTTKPHIRCLSTSSWRSYCSVGGMGWPFPYHREARPRQQHSPLTNCLPGSQPIPYIQTSLIL